MPSFILAENEIKISFLIEIAAAILYFADYVHFSLKGRKEML